MNKMSVDQKRKRINLYKRIIVTTILACILIPGILCVILLVRVHALEKKVEELQSLAAWKMQEDVQPEVPETASQAETEQVEEPSEVLQQAVTEEETTQADERKRVYLTFDDGPSSHTNEILDILKEYNVKATFFVVGKTDEASKAAYRRIVEEGHTLGMHSYSHVYESVYASGEEFEKDFLKLQSYLYEETGVLPVYYRFPGGSSNTISKVDMQEFISCLHKHGIEYFDWNVSNGDGMSRTPAVEVMMENVMKDIPLYEEAVVLMHDDANKHRTVEFLPTLIERLTEQDCVLLPIDDTAEPVQHIRPEE
ncbi:MAG: polysaccharide deacetylase [Lachnospiraceae bacterium]|nr:polysaccharide deacetylase [Lachnospiraceae bacterium]